MSALSRAWERKRKAVLARDGRRCTSCGRAALEVHHLVPGESLRRDMRRGKFASTDALTSLCRNCHYHKHHVPDPERQRWREFVKRMSP